MSEGQHLNAVVHRDYAVPAPIQIRVHDERLRIFNPGSLPEGWTLEKLLGPHPSHPHNPDIAHAFFWAGDIETWGRGISRVIRACRRAGVPSPRIELEPNGLSFEFRFSDAYLESVGGERRTRGEPGASHSSAKARPTRAERILSLLRRDPSLTHAALAKELNLSLHSVRHHLDTLRNSGKLRRVGSRKTGRWEIVE